MNLIILGIVMFAVLSVGGGLGYLVWLKTRPKKMTWDAEIYTISDAIKQEVVNQDGKIIKKLCLQDLRPYAMDIIEKIDRKGVTIYRLQKLGKPVPPIEADLIENWGSRKKVNILYAGGSCTLLNKGYEAEIGKAVYDPMPADRINLLTQELTLKKQRLQQEKDILTAITPWIVGMMALVAIIGLCYIMVSGWVEINEKSNAALEKYADTILRISELEKGKPLNPSVTLGEQKVTKNEDAGS